MTDDDVFRRDLFGVPRLQEPSPGPWRWRKTRAPGYGLGPSPAVFVVLDANGKCVAECERAVDAEFIMRHGPTAEAGKP